jgi:Flp pilus assembly protein TadB
LAHRFRDAQESAGRGDDLGAMIVLFAAVALFVFLIVGIVTAVGLTLYFTAG